MTKASPANMPELASLDHTTALSHKHLVDYRSLTVPQLRKELSARCENTNVSIPNIPRLKKAELVSHLESTPALGVHESYTLNALNLPLLDVENAHDTVGGKETQVITGRLRADSLPIVYVDGSTVLERVTDMTRLSRGDHVCVGLNPVRKISTAFDKLLQYLAHWEVLGVYHHFIVYDDVDYVDPETRTPMVGGKGEGTREDREVRICEYSNTPGGAIKQMAKHGLLSVWRSPAPFKMEPFSDYVEGLTNSSLQAVGMFKIKEELSEEDRDGIVANCDRLLASHETYSFIYRNCEHAAFSFNPKRPTWVSPQVPYLMWNMFRCGGGTQRSERRKRAQRRRCYDGHSKRSGVAQAQQCRRANSLPSALRARVAQVHYERSRHLLPAQQRAADEQGRDDPLQPVLHRVGGPRDRPRRATERHRAHEDFHRAHQEAGERHRHRRGVLAPPVQGVLQERHRGGVGLHVPRAAAEDDSGHAAQGASEARERAKKASGRAKKASEVRERAS
jgi:hypothetical protein